MIFKFIMEQSGKSEDIEKQFNSTITLKEYLSNLLGADKSSLNETFKWINSNPIDRSFVNPKYRFEISCRADENEKKAYSDRDLFIGVANEISRITGIKHSSSIETNLNTGNMSVDFDYGISYMSNRNGNELYFSLTAPNGVELATISEKEPGEFIRRVKLEVEKAAKTIKKTNSIKIMRNEEILHKVVEAIKKKENKSLVIYAEKNWKVELVINATDVKLSYKVYCNKHGFNKSKPYDVIVAGYDCCMCNIDLTQAIKNKILSSRNYIISKGIF